jgi:hypothetical protein
MNYRILEKIGVENTNIDSAEFNNLCTGGESGIVKGVLNECDLVGIQNAVIVSKGLLVIKGIRISIEDSVITLNGNPATATKYYLIAY